jgi:hypothetical protein
MGARMRKRETRRKRHSRLAAVVLLIGCSTLQAMAQHSAKAATLFTSDIRIKLEAGSHAPRLLQIASGSQGASTQIWRNTSEDLLPSTATIASIPTKLVWVLRTDLGHSGSRSVEFVYECDQPHLRLHWIWEARAAFGPVEHRIVIDNLNEHELWLPMIDSLAVDWNAPAKSSIQAFYVEKGANTPSTQGTHREAVTEGFHWTGRSSTYAHPIDGEAREIIPAEFVFPSSESQTGWYAGIEFSGRTRIHLERHRESLSSVLGLDPDPGPYSTRLAVGSSFETPQIFLGVFHGGPDGAANQLRPWVRDVLGNAQAWKDPQYPVTVNNSWGSGMQVDEALALRMIGESKELGLEMFHIDAGWFRGVGDWYPDPKKFPHGLAAIADEAHRQGLRFGIWVDWTQAALDTNPGALNVRDPKVRDWLVNDLPPDWKPEEFKGQTIDLGVPAAKEYAGKEVKRIVEDYHLDMLEHDGYLVAEGCTRDDHPHAPPNRSSLHQIHDSGFDFSLGSNSTDVSYHAVRAYYDIYSQLRREHPNLLLEICNDGGRMVDFGSAAHGDYFSITDSYDPLSNRRAFYDTSYVLPAAMLESYIEKWPVPTLDNFRYMLRSGMMGWTTIMLDTTQWSGEQHTAAKEAIALYKQRLRPMIRDAKLYHISDRPDGVHWDGMQYLDPKHGSGVVFAFRGTTTDESNHSFKLSGLDADGHYRVHYQDGTSPDRVMAGSALLQTGLPVHLQGPISSELIFLEPVDLAK